MTTNNMRANPERAAWYVLTVSFVVFLLLCIGTLYVAQWYVLQSTTEMDISLVVSRGTVQLRPSNTDEPIAIVWPDGGGTRLHHQTGCDQKPGDAGKTGHALRLSGHHDASINSPSKIICALPLRITPVIVSSCL